MMRKLTKLPMHVNNSIRNVKADLKQQLTADIVDMEPCTGVTPDLVFILDMPYIPPNGGPQSRQTSGGPQSRQTSGSERTAPKVVDHLIKRKAAKVPPEGTKAAQFISTLVHVPRVVEESTTAAAARGASNSEVADAGVSAIKHAAANAVPAELREMREAEDVVCQLSELSKECDLTTSQGCMALTKALLYTIFNDKRFEVQEHEVCGDITALAVRWRDEALLEYAEDVHYPVQIEPARLSDLGIELDTPSAGYMPFRRVVRGFARLWPSDDGLMAGGGAGAAGEVLQSFHRQRLLWQYARKWLRIQRFCRNHFIHDLLFPHCEWRLRRLRGMCDRLTFRQLLSPGSLDIDPIRNYFGGHYALYFAFSEYAYKWGLAIFATAIVFDVVERIFIDDQDVRTNVRLAFSLLLSFYGTLFIELWGRETTYWIARWGNHEDENAVTATEHKVICRHFEGVMRPADWDKSYMIAVPNPRKRCLGLATARFVEVTFVSMVVLLVFGPYAYCVKHPSLRKQKALVNMAMSLLCQGIKIIWKNLAPSLVPIEQHKYRHDADESVDRKTTGVNFVCLFAPLFYLVFVLPMAGWCNDNDDDLPQPGMAMGHSADSGTDCIVKEEYRKDLEAALLTQLVSEAMLCVKDIIIPVFFLLKATILEDNDTSGQGQLEREFLMPEYDGYYLAQDYQQLLFPMAFVLLFGSLSRVLTTGTWLLLAFTQRKIDLWKLVHLYRRPPPMELGDTGRARARFIRGISFWSGACNWAQIVGFYPLFSTLDPEDKVMVFLAGMYVITMLKQAFRHAVPNKGKTTRLLEVRGDWQRLRVDAFYNARHFNESGTLTSSTWKGDEPKEFSSVASVRLEGLKKKQAHLAEVRRRAATMDPSIFRDQRANLMHEVKSFELAVAEMESLMASGQSP